jgi:hypothetical protein
MPSANTAVATSGAMAHASKSTTSSTQKCSRTSPG